MCMRPQDKRHRQSPSRGTVCASKIMSRVIVFEVTTRGFFGVQWKPNIRFGSEQRTPDAADRCRSSQGSPRGIMSNDQVSL